MHETEENIASLQELLDRTLARANPHLTSIVSPELRLNARQVVRYLRGTKHVASATLLHEIYASSPFEWGDGAVFIRIEPTSMRAYTFYSESFLE